MTVQQALDEFLLACKADGLSKATTKWYGAMLSPMVAFLADATITTTTASMLRRWVVSLGERGLSEESVNSSKRAMLRFWKWCAKEFGVENPSSNIKHPGTSKGNPRSAISADDAMKILNAAAAPAAGSHAIHAVRDVAIVALLIDTGCRAGGLLSIELKDVNLRKRYFVATEKRAKGKPNIRRVRMSPLAAQALSRWLAARPASDTSAVWLAFDRHGNASGRLTYYGLYSLMKRLARRAGVAGRFNPHAFRHGFGQQYLMNSGDLATASQLMGHSSVKVTADVYGQFESSNLGRKLDKHTPLKKLKD
jgi:integrase/recombinase XerD